jgi:glycosyltransferase involved in cell wall biosynthesis
MKALVPTISVVMPFYNCERFLDQSILSILDQTYTDFEFIIIDDASTDNSDEIVRRYQERDERIIFVKNERNI